MSSLLDLRVNNSSGDPFPAKSKHVDDPQPIEGDHQCEKCSFTTNRLRLLLCHEMVDHQRAADHRTKASYYFCQQCDFGSRWRGKMTQHWNTVHAVEGERRGVPDVIAVDVGAVRRHYRGRCRDGGDPVEELDRLTDDVEAFRQVENCERFTNNNVSKVKKKRKPSTNSSSCKQCNIKYQEHSLWGSSPVEHVCKTGSFHCVSCQVTLDNESDVVKHVHKCHDSCPPKMASSSAEDEPNVCKEEGDGMICICPVCGYSAPSPDLQDKHMVLVHGEIISGSGANRVFNGSHVKEENKNETSTDVETSRADCNSFDDHGFYCNEDGSVDDSIEFDPDDIATSFGQHQRQSEEDSLNSSAVDSRRRYRCNVCTATFPWHGDLAEHLRESHGMEKSRDWRGKAGSYRCTHCKYVAKYQSELRRHMRLHLGVKPFGCIFCQYRSAWKGDLKRHIESHHRDKFSSDMELCKIMAQYKNNAGTAVAAASSMVSLDGEEYCDNEGGGEEDDSLRGGSEHGSALEHVQCVAERDDSRPSSMSDSILSNDNNNDTMALNLSKDCEEKVGRIGCPQCSYMAQNQSKLNNHMASHANLRLYRCPVCGQRSNYKWDIRKHIKSQHPDQSHLQVVQMTPLEAMECVVNTHQLSFSPENTSNSSTDPNIKIERSKSLATRMKKEESVLTMEQLLPQNLSTRDDDKKVPRQKPVQAHTSNDKCLLIPPSLYSTFGQRNNSSQLNHQQFSEGQDAAIDSLPANHPYFLGFPQNLMLSGMFPQLMYNAMAAAASIEPRSSDAIIGKHQHRQATISASPLMVETAFNSNPEIDRLVDNNRSMETKSPREQMSCPTGFYGESSGSSGVGCKGEQWKRFKCSSCGHRSNWKWDINKHIKVAHPERSQARTMMLSLEEARDTLPAYLASARTGKNRGGVHNGGNEPEEGYYRPYKCSLCGHRSNWKWDVNKHIKQVHQGDAVVITLTMDEAKKTIGQYKDRRRQSSSNNTVLSPEVSNHSHAGRKRPTPTNTVVPISHNKNNDVITQGPIEALPNPRIDALRLKRFKCNICGYRSNYRSDIARHNRRKHRGEGRVLILSEVEAGRTLNQYTQNSPQRTNHFQLKTYSNFGLTKKESTDDLKLEGNVFNYSKKNLPDDSLWKCCLCKFSSKDRVVTLRHVTRSHRPLKPFECRVCNFGTDYRGWLLRHLKTSHGVEPSASFMRQNVKKCSTSSASSEGLSPRINTDEDAYEHQFRKNTDKEEGPFVQINCPNCPFKTSKEEVMKVHGMFHQDSCSHVFPCTRCSYRASRADWLANHEVLHDVKESPKVEQQQNRKRTVQDFNSELESPMSKRYNVDPDSVRQKEIITCSRCPFVTDKHRGLILHKQFHRRLTRTPHWHRNCRLLSLRSCSKCGFSSDDDRRQARHSRVHLPGYQKHQIQRLRSLRTDCFNRGERSKEKAKSSPRSRAFLYHLRAVRKLMEMTPPSSQTYQFFRDNQHAICNHTFLNSRLVQKDWNVIQKTFTDSSNLIKKPSGKKKRNSGIISPTPE